MFLNLDNDFKDLLEKFFSTELTDDHLQKALRGENKDLFVWNKFLRLGASEYLTSLLEDKNKGAFTAFLYISFLSGKYLSAEPFTEALFGSIYCPYLINNNLSNNILPEFNSLDCGVGISVLNKKDTFLAPLANGINKLILITRERNKEAKNIFFVDTTNVKKEIVSSFDLLSPLYQISLKESRLKPLKNVETDEIYLLYQLLKSAELAGISEKVVDITSSYAKERKQFGVPVGSFQAVSHKIANMHLKAEASKSVVGFAGWAVDNSKPQLLLAGKSAINFCMENTAELVEDAIQAHGGIGFTYEYPLHLYLRRALSYSLLFGLKDSEKTDLVKSACKAINT